MKIQFLLLSLLAFILISCDKEDDNPAIYLEGTYESEFASSEGNPVYSSEMIFTAAGNVLIETFVTPVDSELRCLRGYSEGTYSLRGEEFSLSLTSSFGPDPATYDIPEGCVSRDLLVNNLNPANPTQKGTLVLDDANNSFLLGYACNDMLGVMSNCVGPQTYIKVD
ncbi:hypothetical protein SYJ56_05160 [Algoriphagus sp. D3-2-R+10]|uniref:hypothetical protein n=1 Tax=Algoriphagus aurantiacus TaxID=3103948 RepID=UPI002B36770B|nr:hypothetical protein [Algoriphagus sp. D3-2-R+10]MEB2774682.1 hypothetical protein [Algoriphagus sp. D3-2-R+10]